MLIREMIIAAFASVLLTACGSDNGSTESGETAPLRVVITRGYNGYPNAYTRIDYRGGFPSLIVNYKAAGPDNVWGTGDDVIGSYVKCQIEDGYPRLFQPFWDINQDLGNYTSGSISNCALPQLVKSASRISSVFIDSPGPDGVWLTADDAVSSPYLKASRLTAVADGEIVQSCESDLALLQYPEDPGTIQRLCGHGTKVRYVQDAILTAPILGLDLGPYKHIRFNRTGAFVSLEEHHLLFSNWDDARNWRNGTKEIIKTSTAWQAPTESTMTSETWDYGPATLYLPGEPITMAVDGENYVKTWVETWLIEWSQEHITRITVPYPPSFGNALVPQMVVSTTDFYYSPDIREAASVDPTLPAPP